MNQRILFLVVMMALSHNSNAQPAANSIQVIAKSKGEGVWLRWAPSNQIVWQFGNRYGYVVERFALSPDGELGTGVKISLQPLKPLPSGDLVKLSSTLEEAEALNELIYETNQVSPNENSIANVLAKKEKLENRFGVTLLLCDLSIQVAGAAGLFVKDTTAIKGQRYIYRVSLSKQTEGVEVNPGVIVVDVTEETPVIEINDLQAEFRDSTVLLNWSTLMHHGTYSFYHIEKSSDGKNFRRVTDMPYAHMSESNTPETAFFVDSLEMNAKTFFYRIAGVTPFGEVGPSSNIVQGKGKNNLTGLLIIREGKIVEMQASLDQKGNAKKTKIVQEPKGFQVKLKWDFPAEEEANIDGFLISRARSADGPYSEASAILPASSRSFDDLTIFQNTYYKVIAVDNQKSDVANSLPFLVQGEDNMPPTVPENLLGTIDLAGIVNLSWENVNDSDLMGYRIFRANSLLEDPVEITKYILNGSSLIDTVNMNVLNKKIYYYAVTVDKNYNASDYSVPLILSRPDTRPPAAPVFIRAEVVRDSIVLRWMNSASDDVAKYKLILIDGDIARTIMTWTQASRKNFYDDKPQAGKTYQYQIIAEDSAGNKSEAITRKIFFETGYRAAVKELKTNTDREHGEITLTWKNETTAIKCIIYRKENNGLFRLYRTFEGDINSLTDKSVVINNTYAYKVQLVFPGGVKSILSDQVEVIF